MTTMQKARDRIAEEKALEREQKFMDILTSSLGDKADEFLELYKEKNLAKLNKFLAEYKIKIAVSFKRDLRSMGAEGWYVPTREYTVYKGDTIIGRLFIPLR